MFAIVGIRSRKRFTSTSWWTGERFGTVMFRQVYSTKREAEEVANDAVMEYMYPTKGVTCPDTGVYYIPRKRPYAVEIVELKKAPSSSS